MEEEDGHVEQGYETADSTEPQGAGQRLAAAREEAGLSLDQVSAETRIPLRHLETIEAGQFHRLPSRTYAIGFTRTYARMLGLDEHEMLDQVRAELSAGDPERNAAPAKFEPGDPGRIPGRGLAWFGVLAAVIFVAGVYTFYRSYFAPGMGPAPLQEESEEAAPAAGETPQAQSTQAARATGPVVFTSEMDGTWVKFYDASGERLYEAQMDEGDTYTVPADAEGPLLWTGRPYALSITVGGRAVPKLSEEDEIVRDVPVTAEALVARSSAGAAPSTATPTSTPTPAGTPIAAE